MYHNVGTRPRNSRAMNDKSSQTAPTDNSFQSLQLPSLAPASLIRQFGPGMILMMTGIGTSHLEIGRAHV